MGVRVLGEELGLIRRGMGAHSRKRVAGTLGKRGA